MKLRRMVTPAQLAVAAFGLVYALLGLFVFDATSLLSVDAAIKLLQAQALLASGYASLAIPHASGPLDPAGAYLPFGQPFVFWTGERLEGIFPSSVALLNSAVLWAGIHGIAALSVVSAVAALAAVAFIADDRLGLGTVIVLGAASPLWFYAALPWEHAPALGLWMWALALAFRTDGRTTQMLASWLGGLAATLRDEFLVTLPILIALVFVRFGWRRALTAAALAVAPTVLVGAADLWVFQRPPAAHIAHAVQPIAHVVQASIPQRPSWTLAERYQTAVVDWLLGLWPEWWKSSVVLLAVLTSIFLLPRRRAEAVLSVVILVAIVHIHDLSTYLAEPAFIAGLFRLSPALIFAVLPVASNQRSSRLRCFSIVASASFMLVTLTFLSTDGGTQLGPRLLLPIVPLLALAAWEGLGSYGRSTELPDRIVWILGLVLVGGSVVMQVGVAGRAYYDLNSKERVTVEWLKASPERVLVVDAIYTMNITVHDYGTRPILLASSQESAAQIARLLRRGNVGGFLYISRDRDAVRMFPGFHPSSTRATSLTTFQYWKAAS